MRRLTIAVTASLTLVALLPAASAATPVPSTWTLESHWGARVDKNGQNVCVDSTGECQSGSEGSEAGGFSFPEGVAVAPSGNVYVSDTGNNRIQEFTPTGEFVLMFGQKVNKGGGNVCTKAEMANCQEGERGTGLPGQISHGKSVAIAQATGDVYVLLADASVEKFTGSGEFLLMIGGKVNKTKAEAIEQRGGAPSRKEVEEENICTEAEITTGVTCQSGLASEPGSTVPDEFKPAFARGSLLSVDPASQDLYVGDEGRVQKIEASGKWAGEIAIGAETEAIAAGGGETLFVVSEGADLEPATVAHEYKAGVLQSCVISSSGEPIQALAFDAFGRLGLLEANHVLLEKSRGGLYETESAECGTKVSGSEFGPLPGTETVALAFATSKPSEPLTDRMYIPQYGPSEHPMEIDAFTPAPFPVGVTLSPAEVTSTSAKFLGEINPNGVLSTGLFAYGTKQHHLSLRTPIVFEGLQESSQPIQAVASGLTPNQKYWYAVAARSESHEATFNEVMFHTSTPAPEVPGVPVVSFVHSDRVVFSGQVNPEHAETLYYFQYAPCPRVEGCPVINTTEAQKSSEYGVQNVTQEATGLTQGTTYSYRLVAENGFKYEGTTPEGGLTKGGEGEAFTTPEITPEAITGAPNALTTTSAIVYGEVNPDGHPATYVFEVGIYNGAGTQFGVVQSASAGEGTTMTPEAVQLSGLQPGTTYAYRIAIQSAYVKTEAHIAYGATGTFETQGVPPIFIPTSPSPVPFPQEIKFTHTKCKRGYTRNSHGKCVKTKPKKKGKRSRKPNRARHGK